jgi:hypothetical protein
MCKFVILTIHRHKPSDLTLIFHKPMAHKHIFINVCISIFSAIFLKKEGMKVKVEGKRMHKVTQNSVRDGG